jgi:hypothetical protein
LKYGELVENNKALKRKQDGATWTQRLYEVRDPIAVMTLNRPEQRNSFDAAKTANGKLVQKQRM